MKNWRNKRRMPRLSFNVRPIQMHIIGDVCSICLYLHVGFNYVVEKSEWRLATLRNALTFLFRFANREVLIYHKIIISLTYNNKQTHLRQSENMEFSTHSYMKLNKSLNRNCTNWTNKLKRCYVYRSWSVNTMVLRRSVPTLSVATPLYCDRATRRPLRYHLRHRWVGTCPTILVECRPRSSTAAGTMRAAKNRNCCLPLTPWRHRWYSSSSLCHLEKPLIWC